MKRVLKVIIYHTECFIKTLKWVIFQLRFENFKNYYKVKNRPNKLIILANGPSLKKQIEENLEILSSSDLFVVNEFCKHELFYI